MGAARRNQPEWIEPQLATLTHDRFSGPGWIFERKFDGERCLAFRKGGEVRLFTRNRKPADAAYPEIAEALAAQRADDFVVDGEVVAFDGNVTSFARLQRRIQLKDPELARGSGIAVFYYVFDLLRSGGRATAEMPLLERKSVLRGLLSFDDPLRFTMHKKNDGEAYWRSGCEKGWEGVIAKRADAAYRSGRSRDWLKFKCENAQEFVIGGYTDPKGSRTGFGALLLGYYNEEGKLACAGKVGTGFDHQTLRRLHDELSSIQRKTPPFERGTIPERGAHWVEPRLVGQVAFTEWTADGQLRHPRFQGLRRDKSPSDVVKERPR
jgi:bifunctional non-homologous end joining protein LigD